MIAGHVQMMFATAASVIGHIQSGKVRALAVTTLKRTAMLPDIPTMDELGLKGFDATTWHGLVAPAGHAARGDRDAASCGGRGAARSRRAGSLGDLGVDIVGDTPQEFEAYINREIPKWTAIVKASGATLDKSYDEPSGKPDGALAAQRAPPRPSRSCRARGRSTIAGHHAYVGHIPNKDNLGTSIIDIADPYNPRVVATVTLDDPTSHSHKVRVVGDVMIVNHERNTTPIGRRAEQLPAVRRELRDALGREPTRGELAQKLNVTEADLVAIEAAEEQPYRNGGFQIYDVSQSGDSRS